MAIEVLEIEMPFPPSYQTRGGPEFSTIVNTLTGGAEDTVQLWQRPRWRWEVTLARLKLEDLQRLEEFAIVVAGRARGFLFTDPIRSSTGAPPVVPQGEQAAPTAFDALIGTGDGVARDFVLRRPVAFGGASATYRTTRPLPGSVLVAVGGSEVPASLLSGGVVRLGEPAPAGQPVTAGWRWRFPARLEDDWLPSTLDNYRQGVAARLTLVEIREEV